MLTPNHPNALWLAKLYRGSAAIESDLSLDEQTRTAKLAEHMRIAFTRVSPNLVIHTGGLRLATTLSGPQVHTYAARRKALSGGTFRVIKVDQVLADDLFGLIYATVVAERNGRPYESRGMGAWRFDGDMAVEHWEIPHGELWDHMLLDDSADLKGTAEEFWLRN
jgi:hypothetical protein